MRGVVGVPEWVDTVTTLAVLVGTVVLLNGCLGVASRVLEWVWKTGHGRTLLIGGLTILLAKAVRATWGQGYVAELILVGAPLAFVVWMVRGWLLGLIGLLAPYGWFKGEK
jgi:hypothetical protein